MRKRRLNGKGMVHRTAHEAEKLIDSVRVQVAPVSRDIIDIAQEVKSKVVGKPFEITI